MLRRDTGGKTNCDRKRQRNRHRGKRERLKGIERKHKRNKLKDEEKENEIWVNEMGR